jgi:protein tyrosine phosphatase (PTP) superfamily phosphohydrolase (DUF442 family)
MATIRRLLMGPAAGWLLCAASYVAAHGPLPERINTPLLPNVYRLHERVYSGGSPKGEAAFASLKEMGVKTIVSVDGAKPDAETARKYGLRYVHLPHGYDGIPGKQVQALAKAVRDLPGPVYIHCHHGHHRSPAAATVACVSIGLLQPESAENVLQTAGTSENYRGLYQSAREARKIDDRLLDALQVEFPESVRVPPIAEAMIDVEHAHDHLKAFAAAKWQALPKHPDLDPAHEALLLREHYHELLRTGDVKRQPAAFQKLLEASENSAQALEDALRPWVNAGSIGDPPKEVNAHFAAVSTNCVTCHQKFRDVPLQEKHK